MMGVSLVASFAACIYPWINSFALMTIGVPTFVLLTKELKRFVWKFFFSVNNEFAVSTDVEFNEFDDSVSDAVSVG